MLAFLWSAKVKLYNTFRIKEKADSYKIIKGYFFQEIDENSKKGRHFKHTGKLKLFLFLIAGFFFNEEVNHINCQHGTEINILHQEWEVYEPHRPSS